MMKDYEVLKESTIIIKPRESSLIYNCNFLLRLHQLLLKYYASIRREQEEKKSEGINNT